MRAGRTYDDRVRATRRAVPASGRTRAVAALLAVAVGLGLVSCSSMSAPGPVPSTTAPSGTTRSVAPSAIGPSPTSVRAATAPTAPAARVESGAESGRVAAAVRLMQTRTRAVQGRDKAAWMATVDDPRSPFGVGQARMFDNLMALPDEGFTYDAPAPAAPLSAGRARAVGPGAWVGQTQGHYELAGYDRSPRTFSVAFTFVLRPGGWRISADSDGVTTRQVWDLPGMTVVRGATSLVIGNDSSARLRSFRDEADAGVVRVTAVWGPDWSSRVVLLAPATEEQFAALLHRTGDKGLDQLAAVTVGSTLAGTSAGGDRVVINPLTYGDLGPSGRRVVVTHELTHVAARSSTTRAVPLWLSEGLADYVGYSGLDLPRARIAAPFLDRVRTAAARRRLPTDADFDPGRAQIAPAYAAAWLACVRLADRYGQGRLVAFYRAAAGAPAAAAGPSADGAGSPSAVPSATGAEAGVAAETSAAFRSVLGTTEPAFVSSWWAYAASLARS